MLKVAVIGAGRMGGVVGRQLPDDVEKLILDKDETKAKALADKIGGRYASTWEAVETSDIIAVILPTSEIDPTMDQLVRIAKDNAVIMNMATKGTVDSKIAEKNNKIHIVETKIIGHARSIEQGAPAYVVVGIEDQMLLEKIRHILPGFKKVLMGSTDIIPEIARIGSSEGIRAAITVRKLLKPYKIPKDWEDIVIYTICAGTMRSYIEDDLGHFAKELAERLTAEEQDIISSCDDSVDSNNNESTN